MSVKKIVGFSIISRSSKASSRMISSTPFLSEGISIYIVIFPYNYGSVLFTYRSCSSSGNEGEIMLE